MKKTLFYILSLIALVLLVDMINILTNDFERLTDYGVGYLVGKTVLFIMFLLSMFLLRRKILKNKKVS